MSTMVAGRECELGCDVSRWQGSINYSVFDLAFVFIKATGGDNVLYTDSKWSANSGGFAAEGVPEGPYHFAGRQDPMMEADYFSNVILDSPWADLGPDLKLPPTLDAEWTNPHFGAGSADWSVRFLERVEARTGIEPIIYSAGWVGLEADPRLLRYAFWLAAYVQNPDFYPCAPWGTDWSIWQYSSTGSVSGISGNCDTNAARVDWLASVLGRTPVPPTPPSPPVLRGGAMLVLKFPDKDNLYVYGVDRAGDWCAEALLDNEDTPAPPGFVRIDPVFLATLPVWMLASGNDEIDARFHRLTGL